MKPRPYLDSKGQQAAAVAQMLKLIGNERRVLTLYALTCGDGV
jgi:hypothetical protein